MGRLTGWIRGGGAMAVCLVAAAAQAQTPGAASKGRLAAFAQQTRLLDSRAAEQYSASVRLKPDYAIPGREPEQPRYAGSYRGEYVAVARRMAQRHGVPEEMFLRLVQQESGWNPRARSHKGALGLAQLMPATARRLGVDPHDPEQNLEGGARYLRRQFETFRDWRLALAAYNAGPGAVLRYKGVPPYRETRGYVAAILGG